MIHNKSNMNNVFIDLFSLHSSVPIKISRISDGGRWEVRSGNPEYFSLWQFTWSAWSGSAQPIRAEIRNLPAGDLEISRVSLPSTLAPWQSARVSQPDAPLTPHHPSQPLTAPAPGENVDPGKVPWPCLDVWAPEIAPSVRARGPIVVS